MWQSLYELHSEPPKLRKPVLICDGCWKPIPPAHCYCTAVYTADSNHKSKAAQAGQICDGCWKPIPPVHCYCTAVYTADSNHKSKGAQASSIMWWMLETHASCTLFLCALRISSLKQSRFLCKPVPEHHEMAEGRWKPIPAACLFKMHVLKPCMGPANHWRISLESNSTQAHWKCSIYKVFHEIDLYSCLTCVGSCNFFWSNFAPNQKWTCSATARALPAIASGSKPYLSS